MTDLNLTNFDYLILIIIGYSVLAAFYKGLVRACTSFFGWVISFIGSYLLFAPLESIVTKIVTNHLGSVCISLFLGFVLSIIISSITTNKILDLTPNIRGGIVDRSLGFAFGFVRGIIISCLVYQITILASPLFLSSSEDPVTGEVNQPLPESVKKAKTLQLLKQGSSLLASFVPKDLAQKQIKMLTDKMQENAINSISSESEVKDAPKEKKKSDREEKNKDKDKDKDKKVKKSINDDSIDTDNLINSLNDIKANIESTKENLDTPKEGPSDNGIDITDVIKKINELTK